jgi:signal transduction histidine kinase
MTPLAEKRGQTLLFEAGATDAVAEVDPERLQQVLVILLDNAMKYTPDGGRIEVQVHSEPDAAVIEVSDTGATGRTGLGLAIAKLLVEAHGGELTLSSTVGVGTRARVRLPLASSSMPARGFLSGGYWRAAAG